MINKLFQNHRKLIFYIVFILFTIAFSIITLYNSFKFLEEDLSTFTNYNQTLTYTILTIAGAIFVAPILEEFVFRSWLDFKNSKLNLYFFIFSIIYFISQIHLVTSYKEIGKSIDYYLYNNTIPFFNKDTYAFILKYWLFIPTTACYLVIQKLQFKINISLKPLLLIYSFILFSWLHIDIQTLNNFNIFFFTPYLISALILTYFRLNFSLKSSILLHMMNNAMAATILYSKKIGGISNYVITVLILISFVELVYFYIYHKKYFKKSAEISNPN